MPKFQLHEQLSSSSIQLIDWPLSRVLLKNNANYPWCILVPRQDNITEITELSKLDRYQLADEVHHLSVIMQDLFKPNKINIGALGNIVAQLHIHVVARFRHDQLWPQGIWQSAMEETPYVEVNSFITKLIDQLSHVEFV